MKATRIISALFFAHAAFAQATDSTSGAVSVTTSSSVEAAATSSVASTTPATSSSVEVQSSASSTPSSTKTSTKTGSKANSPQSSEPASTSSANTATPTGNGGGKWEDGTQTLTSNDGNPLIPSNISDGCSTYLNKLNSDTALASCLNSQLTTMSAFTGSSSGSPSAVNKAMNNVCSSNACSTSMLRSKLTEFKDACSDELTGENPNKIVAANYDTLYVLAPLKSALCSKDPATQAYCVLGTGSSGNSKRSLAPSSDVLYARDHLANTFISRKRASQSVDVINPDTYRNSHIMYLFASPDMNAGELCTECTSEILASYIRWESTVPHAMGVANSPTLSGQPEMWSAIQDKCPASFSTEINNSVAPDTSSASRVVAGSTITALAGALAALVALA